MARSNADPAHAVLGVSRLHVLEGVDVDVLVPVDVGVDATRLTICADRDLADVATGRFSAPSVGVSWARDQWPDHIEFLGFAFTQFALPVTSGRDLTFDFAPAPGLRSPSAMLPFVARAGDRVVLLAPLDHFHEQIVAVTDDGLFWGWHGDLDEVPAGFSTTLGVYESRSVTDALSRWRADLAVSLDRVGDNVLSTHLSYWTDNGAAYWYRTEPGRTIADSVVDVVEALRSDDVPVRSVELDSWFYDHVVARPITEIGYPEEVPPTGMLRWEPRVDAFGDAGGQQVADLSRRLGLPLVLHSRHIAPESPYVTDEGWWVGRYAAQPQDPAFFRRWFDDAQQWGATVIEQDWMQVYWFAVRELRAVPGRAEAWQRALDEHAGATGVDLLWCMATPADLMLAASLDRVIAVRTSDDYRFNDDPAFLWTWFLVVNRLADCLGLPVFKDCFFSNPAVHDRPDENDDASGGDAIDGDRHAELEAALAALSNGPVGIGDRIGRTDRGIVMRTCDDDGRLRRLDGPIAAIDRCLFGGPARGDDLMWATTSATNDAGTWTYVLAINTSIGGEFIDDVFDLSGESTVYDWRRRTSRAAASIDLGLDAKDWALFVVSPPGRPAAGSVGDPDRYVVVESAAS